MVSARAHRPTALARDHTRVCGRSSALSPLEGLREGLCSLLLSSCCVPLPHWQRALSTSYPCLLPSDSSVARLLPYRTSLGLYPYWCRCVEPMPERMKTMRRSAAKTTLPIKSCLVCVTLWTRRSRLCAD